MSGLTEEEVVAQLDEEGNGRLWEDEEFPADIASLYRYGGHASLLVCRVVAQPYCSWVTRLASLSLTRTLM